MELAAGGATRQVLVAGGTGVVGREVVRELRERGHQVRVCARGAGSDGTAADVTRPETLRGVCDGVDVVVSTVGGSLDIRKVRDRTSYDSIDHLGNRALLAEAERVGVRRFVYVSVFSTPEVRRLEYVAAHVRFEEALRESRLAWGVVRPTGVFAFFLEVLNMAARGRAVVLGDGSARTNPVHEADVADAVADAVVAEDGALETDIGGPETLSRRDIAETAFRVVGREPRITAAPPGALRAAAAMFLPMNPRLSALLRFGTEVSLADAIAPAVGSRRLEEYFAEKAAVTRG